MTHPDTSPMGTAETSAIAGPVEALLLMAEEPVPAATLAAALDVPVDEVTACLEQLVRFYDQTHRGFELRHLGGGWRYYTRAEHAEVISAYVLSGQTAKLSQAALETLSVIAYTQPISRSRVAAVRGVSVDGVIRTLLARDLITEAGQDHETGAVVFRTTEYFLERMGLRSLDDLPDLAPHLPEVADLEAELGELARTPPPGPADDAPPDDDQPTTEPEQGSGDLAQVGPPTGREVDPR